VSQSAVRPSTQDERLNDRISTSCGRFVVSWSNYERNCGAAFLTCSPRQIFFCEVLNAIPRAAGKPSQAMLHRLDTKPAPPLYEGCMSGSRCFSTWHAGSYLPRRCWRAVGSERMLK
jgi:hypothetical protein